MRSFQLETMVLCPECDPYTCICDFCKYYQFNGEDVGSRHGPAYVDKGCCSLHFLREDPEGGCEYFHCCMGAELMETADSSLTSEETT